MSSQIAFIPGMVNAFDPGAPVHLPDHERRMIERRNRLLGPAYRLFYEEPVNIVRGRGVWLEDPEGNKYLDMYNNVASVGHCHPRVVEAMTRQIQTLNTHTRYLHDTILNYADDLLATFPANLKHAMFTCTGSEANDLAYRIAKDYTGGTGVIVTSLAYHGITDAVSQFSPSLGSYVPLGTHVRSIPAPDAYRRDPATLGRSITADVRAAIADMNAHGVKLAAFICDTIFASDGVFTDPAGFLTEAVTEVQKAGGLFIADEVQPGFGRTGTGMWAFHRHGVHPDIVTVGKPMGNGQPIAGAIMRSDVVERFGRRARYFNTYGGNPVSCAAAQAVLDVIKDDGLIENARVVGDAMLTGLRGLATRHEAIGDVRGIGLFVGVEMVKDRLTKEPDPKKATEVVNGLRRRKILIGAAGPHANNLKIRPPLVFSLENVQQFLFAIDEVLTEG